ncbi:MAG: SDR family oxidoreductase [Verrucomicrobiales bacterium]|jgi:NAD(P)-dependent dehydrogenase (short-subunit alcohol dehydrogenase family)|nr:SDR family oxidoreductase [Verrucomicrobiales bacterium]MDP4793099.1 SDR family oxidoreductase [Verrucomicrobiales bacterium]MDP4940143.1 SDR family oxidoreductase [Verrucomicrobiales bacterium]MDP5004624.1 SDR family oxidoreductase [Verrucomicrobiales bacterium]
MNLKDKVILVTGGTSGIGEACARHFASLGARVVIASNQEERGIALEEELREAGQEVIFIFTDVSQESSVKAMVDHAVATYGRLDGVHCNAGVWGKGRVTEFDDAAWEKIMGVNVKSVFWTAKHAIPVMEEHGQGVFLITTSVAAFIGFPAHALYCASKGALESLVRCLAADHAGKVRVVGICPGTIDTPMLAATCEGWDKPVEELYAEVAKKIPVRRLGQPIDIAKTAAFLLSEDSEYINATSIVLDGGTMALPPW